MSPTPTIGVGVVGLSADGGWAALAHEPALRAVDGFALRGLSTRSPDSARAAAAKYGVPLAFDNAEDLAQHPDIDLVVVAVKVPHHAEVVQAALDAGRMVLSEWPLAVSVAEARLLAGRAERVGARTAVGLQARSSPVLRYVRDLVAEGYVGTVLSTGVVGSGMNWGATFAPRSRYQLDPANGATLVTIPLGHTLDAVSFVLGDVRELQGTTATRRHVVREQDSERTSIMTAPDQVAVTGLLADGAVAAVRLRGGMSRAANFRWEINGTEGDLVMGMDWAHIQFGRLDLAGARGTDELAPLPIPGRYHQVPGLDRQSAAYNVAASYRQLYSDVVDDAHTVPDFAHAVALHRLLAVVQR